MFQNLISMDLVKSIVFKRQRPVIEVMQEVGVAVGIDIECRQIPPFLATDSKQFLSAAPGTDKQCFQDLNLSGLDKRLAA